MQRAPCTYTWGLERIFQCPFSFYSHILRTEGWTKVSVGGVRVEFGLGLDSGSTLALVLVLALGWHRFLA